VNSINNLDTELLEGYIDNLGKEIVQQMLDLYIQQSVEYMRDINNAIEQESQSLWQERCHKMKGATGSAGLIGVHSHLKAIEKTTDNWSDKKKLVEQLKQLNEAAILSFTQWLSEK